MTSSLFIFGRSTALSAAELAVFFPHFSLVYDGIAMVDVDIGDPDTCIAKLGGTVKIAQVVSRQSDISPQILAEYIATNSQTIKTFGISWYPQCPKDKTGYEAEVKDLLHDNGISVRYVKATRQDQLSSVTVATSHACEFIITPDKSGYILARTVAVQPFAHWSKVDYGRPYADAKHGMLPPKVARMAVNIALGSNPSGKILCDPFCGMGTVLGEAMLVGAGALGFDIYGEVISKARKNLEWLGGMYPETVKSEVKLDTADAVHLSAALAPASVDAIVTEPYMGTSSFGEGKVSPAKAKDIIRGLEKLYLGCLRDWAAVLKPGGKIFIAFPSVRMHDSIINVKRPIDTCENLGYTKILGPIAYAREQAVVVRNFYLFEYGTR